MAKGSAAAVAASVEAMGGGTIPKGAGICPYGRQIEGTEIEIDCDCENAGEKAKDLKVRHEVGWLKERTNRIMI